MKIRPSWFQVLLTLLGVSLFVTLSVWQWSRAQEKQQWLDELTVSNEPQLLSKQSEYRSLVTATGYYMPHTILLDNQIYAGIPGYAVLAVLRTTAGDVLVQRGWVANVTDTGATVLPAGQQTVEGYWMPIPRAGMKLGQETKPASVSNPLVLNFPNLAQIEAVYDTTLYNGRVLQRNADVMSSEASNQSPELAGSLVRDVQPMTIVGIKPARHLGYALTWACFAVISIILLLIFARQRAKALSV